MFWGVACAKLVVHVFLVNAQQFVQPFSINVLSNDGSRFLFTKNRAAVVQLFYRYITDILRERTLLFLFYFYADLLFDLPRRPLRSWILFYPAEMSEKTTLLSLDDLCCAWAIVWPG